MGRQMANSIPMLKKMPSFETLAKAISEGGPKRITKRKLDDVFVDRKKSKRKVSLGENEEVSTLKGNEGNIPGQITYSQAELHAAVNMHILSMQPNPMQSIYMTPILSQFYPRYL